MADFSDDSDVNPEEMARMVEELEDLDDELLGVKSKKDSFPVGKKDTEVKKKISFKDTFDDDPLADFSDNDDDLYTTKKSTISGNSKSNRLADLFGIKNSDSSKKDLEPEKMSNTIYSSKIGNMNEKSAATDAYSTIATNKMASSVQQTIGRSTLQKEQSRINEEAVANVDDRPKSTTNRDRKSTLMEDIFGSSRGRSPASKETMDSRSGLPKFGLDDPSGSMLSQPAKPDKSAKSTMGYGTEPSKVREPSGAVREPSGAVREPSGAVREPSGAVREPRRGRRNSPIISDPLGLFSQPLKQPEPTADIGPKAEADTGPEKSSSQNDLPEWLGGSSKSKDNKTETGKQRGEPLGHKSEAPKNVIGLQSGDAHSQSGQIIGSTNFSEQSNKNIFHPEMSMLMGSQFDQQAAMISMQQQEHELRTAATLSHQNDQMTQIVESQRSKLEEQERMFNVLIKRQIDRQSMLETQMRIQQARIDHYIHTLMAQPSSMPTVTTFASEAVNPETENKVKEETPDSLVRQLQVETDHLEMTLERLKEKHEKEIQILEESYEKQISFLRQCIEKLEKKLDRDNETLENEYEKKLEKLRDEKEQMEQNYRDEMEKLKKNEKQRAEEMHERHSHNVELLEKEHAETIDGITRAKELEREAVEIVTNRKTDIGDLLERSKIVFDGFQNLQKRLEDRDDEFGQTRESYLKKQDENLQLLRDQLNLQQEAVAEERKRLVECCQRLDTATVNFTVEFGKKSSMINETEERLATRERELIRERQLFDEQMKWEREHLQMMKETWMKEQERQFKLLSEDREAIATERTKLQVMTRLQGGSDNMARVELEAALKTAQQAENDANLEMRKWQERSNDLETQRRAMREKERELVQRSKELENSVQSALATRDEGLQALKEAQRIEKQHKERLSQLQSQLENLAQRENKVAMEKLALARERLSTFVRPEKPEKDVVETAESVIHRNDQTFLSNLNGSTHFKDVVDPHLLLLKLNLDNKLDTSNELLAAMNMTDR